MAVAEVYGENSSDYSNIISAPISRVAAREIKDYKTQRYYYKVGLLNSARPR